MDNFYQNGNNVNIRKDILEEMAKWSGFLGICNIVFGALACLGAIVTFGFSLIPGIIQIIMGVKLNNAKKSANAFIYGDYEEINNCFENLKTYLKINSILIIVSLVLGIIGVIAIIAAGASMMDSLMPVQYY